MKNNNKTHLDDSNDNSGNKITKDVSNSKITLKIKSSSNNKTFKNTINDVIIINPFFDKITPINIINSKTNDINE